MFNGARLRQVREQAGLTREQLSDLSDVGETTIYEWEARGKGPRTLLSLARALGVNPAVFFDPGTQENEQHAAS